ncbi:OLC1v1013618C1 [Oldenlandia corymbosa var. corymbosa]|uniref:OLC1v1013618C1 n=1 Tax=Oldenlandia corymbosa var. corymbosa TaxID=529605 RepID=A0AAV1DZ52_OLDCO|nr:OLC1v1013618C1 [Oldenlandia corymbosa var. corymbosa]
MQIRRKQYKNLKEGLVFESFCIEIVIGIVAPNNRMTDKTIFIDHELNYIELVDKVCRAAGFDKGRVTVSFVLVWTDSSGRRGYMHIHDDKGIPLVYLVSQNWPELYVCFAPIGGVDSSEQATGAGESSDEEDGNDTSAFVNPGWKAYEACEVETPLSESWPHTEHDKVRKGVGKLASKNPVAAEWLDSIGANKWTLLGDGDNRWGVMTTNTTESYNNALKGARLLPIIALIKSFLLKTVKLFNDNYEKIEKCQTVLTPHYMAKYNKWRLHGGDVLKLSRISRGIICLPIDDEYFPWYQLKTVTFVMGPRKRHKEGFQGAAEAYHVMANLAADIKRMSLLGMGDCTDPKSSAYITFNQIGKTANRALSLQRTQCWDQLSQEAFQFQSHLFLGSGFDIAAG